MLLLNISLKWRFKQAFNIPLWKSVNTVSHNSNDLFSLTHSLLKINILQINNSKLFLAVFSAVLGNFSFGYSLVFSSPVIPQLKSPDADPRLRMNTTQAAWFGSIYTLGAAVGGLGAMLLNDKIGRKLSIMVSAVPSSIGWVLKQKRLDGHFTQFKSTQLKPLTLIWLRCWVNGVYVLWWTCGISGLIPENPS